MVVGTDHITTTETSDSYLKEVLITKQLEDQMRKKSLINRTANVVSIACHDIQSCKPVYN